MEKELIEFNDFKSNNITVSGVPHFDLYFKENKNKDKTNIKQKFDIDASKK